MSTKQGLKWEPWLAEHFQDLVDDNPLNVGYRDSIDKRDERFQGTATHGLARSSTSFTFESMKKIISKMPPEQLVKTDKDRDLPVHSAILSGYRIDKKIIGLFVQGDSEQIKKILRAKNSKGKTPIELAFETQHHAAVKLLFNLCVQHDVLSNLTGINFNMLDRSNTLLHIAFRESKWSWFLDIVIDACKQFHHDIIPAIQVLDKEDYTPFHYLMNCIPDDSNELDTFRAMLDLLKQNGVDINKIYTDSNGRTMLHEAHRRNNTHTVSLLVEYNHKDVSDKQGIKPSQRRHHISRLSEDLRLTEHYQDLVDDNPLNVGYRDSIDKLDEKFRGSTSFTFESMKKMPPEQLVKTDKDEDLPGETLREEHQIPSTSTSGPPANQVMLQELIKQYSLTDEQLNSEIEDPDIPKLALCFDNVELYSSSMGLAIADVKELHRIYDTQAAMMKCLQIWKQHNPYQATYGALLDIVLGVGKGDTAHQICQQLTPRDIGETVVEVTNKSMKFSNFGIKISVLENSLPKGIDMCVLHISFELTTDFEIPANSELVSSIYHVKCEPKVQFKKPVVLEIQHCASLSSEHQQRLVFARATDQSKQFEILEGGHFPIGERYGSIQLTRFSRLGVFIRKVFGFPIEKIYSALLFRNNLLCDVIDTKCVICQDLDTHVKVIREALERDGFTKEMDLDQIQFENAVEMELHSENPELWTVTRVSSTLSRDRIDGYSKVLDSNSRRGVVPAIHYRFKLKEKNISESVNFLLTKTDLDEESHRLILHIDLPQTLGTSDSATQRGSTFVFLIQPKGVYCKPGDEAEFTVSTSPSDRSIYTYQWFFDDQAISLPKYDEQNLLPEYKGQKSERLLILKVLPKHKGVYSCIAEDESGTQITSQPATLTAEGETIENQELQFIGKILENSAIDFGKYGIKTVDLLNGVSGVTYEEMEFVMKLNLKTRVLSLNLKQEITSRLKEEQLYDEAMKSEGKVSLTYTKILALGPGQVGKSTFINRLLGKMEGNIQTSLPETQPQSSTGLSEVTEACIQCSTITGAVSGKKWCVVKDELCDQLSGLMSLIINKPSQGPKHKITKLSKKGIPKTIIANKVEVVEKESVVDAFPLQEEEKHDYTLSNENIEIHSVEALPDSISSSTPESSHDSLIPQESDIINKTIKEFQELREERSRRLDPDSMDFEMLFTVADVGGQPAFLEMLPSLTIGPALYLVFMKLKQDLTFRSRAEFKPKNSSTKYFENYSYTSEEVIFTALSSIACFGHSDEQVEKYVKPASDKKKRKGSVVLLVGTFLDEIQNDLQQNLDKINGQLEERLKNTAFFEEGLVHRIKLSKDDSLLVNNLSAKEGEIEKHRDLLENILKNYFREYQIPAQWLMLSICLKLLARNQNKYHISFDDCVKLGKHIGMDEDMVSVALQFLHKYIGLIMYFPHHENLQKIVICNPQVVFSTISELIFNIYDHNKNQVNQAKCDHFVQTGCFSPKDIQLETVNQEKNKLLSIETLVDLLVYLHIAAKVPLSSNRDTQEYFLPAVLQTAETDMVQRRKKLDRNEELLPEPICIRFKTGYLPLGFVCALSANLIAEKKFDLLIGESKCYKNRILFRFDGKFDIAVISCPRYCEFRVLKHSPGNTEFWNDDCCPLIKEIVRAAANKVIQSMQHGLRSIGTDSEMYKLAFHCPREVHSKAEFGQESLAIICHSDQDTHVPKAKCTHPECKTVIDPLTPGMSVWFGEHPSISLKIKTQPARKGNVVTISADGLRPLTYEWFLGKKKLCDINDQDYDGYTTDRLVIKNDLFLTEGVLMCKVKDKSTDCVAIESDELDLFEEELRNTWKLQEEEIGKIKDKGFKSVRNLQGVQLNKLESLFNMAEKIRMKPLLDFLRNAAISVHGAQHSAPPAATASSLQSDQSGAQPEGAGGLRTVTVEELKERTKVTDSELDEQIDQKDIFKLSNHFGNVDDYMIYLELTPSQQRCVKDLRNTQSAVAEALMLWRKRNPSAATYRALIKIVLNANDSQLAISLCHHLYNNNTTSSSFIFSIQPKDVCCKPGENAEFSISTSPSATRCTYQWYFENQAIVTTPDSGYEGQQSQRLQILNIFPKHKGNYCCIAEDKSGTRMKSHHAVLTADGEVIEREEMQYIGKILEKSVIDFGKYGIENVHLLNGDGKVTYEEMEFVMKLNPRTKVFSINLKQEITSRRKEEHYYAIAIKKVSLTYTKILALGPGQVGKSTFIRRLLGIMKENIQTSPPETQPKSSTGISEIREACIQCTRLTGAITINKRWCVVQDDLHSQLSGLISLIVKQPQDSLEHEIVQTQNSPESSNLNGDENPTEAKEATTDDASSKEEKCEDQTIDLSPGNESTETQHVGSPLATTKEPNPASQSVLMPQKSESDIEKTINDFKTLEHECKHRLEKMEIETLFNIVDVGGQPAFLEMLPSLTIGPALYLVFMNLKQGLSSRYSVLYKCKDSNVKLCENYSYTSEEVLFAALSSIACFGHSDEQVEKYVSDKQNSKTDSLALLVGTFVDEIQNDEKLQLTTAELEKRLENTAFYEEGLIHRKNFSLLVNNMSAEDTEIKEHRKLLEDVLQTFFRKYQIPAQWLKLSIYIKLLATNRTKYLVSIDDCIDLGNHLNMDKDEVSVALQFLHKYVGLVMYFPNHKNLKKIVICDPQVVFLTISELIFNIYDHNKNLVSEAKYDRFVQTGCFSPKDIKLDQPMNKLLSIDTLVELLVYIHIAAKVPDNEEYFLPAVLQTAETEIIKRKQKGENEEMLPEPICIRFNTGYVPLGFVCALSANLIAENKFDLLVGESNKCYKNRILFRFDGKFNIAVISCPKYCEFRVSRHSGKDEFWSKNCCPLIREIISTAAENVIQSMQHGSALVGTDSEMHTLAFHCPRHPDADFGQESLAKLVYEDSDQTSAPDEPCKAKCINPECVTTIDPLVPEMMVWFGKAPSIPLKIEKQPARKGNVISIRAKGVRPLTYEWFLDNKPLTVCDDQNYGGLTTDKLEILDNISLARGVFKCRVKDKVNSSEESDELDLFEEHLRKTWNLQEEEISKLKCNGFKSVTELKDIQLSDLDFLNMAEKRRIEPLLSSVQKRSASEDYPSKNVEITSKPSVLTGADIPTIRERLDSASKDWFNLGLSFGITFVNLKNIEEQYHENNRRLTEVVGKRLEIVDQENPITWPYICKCLRCPTVNRSDVASEIEKLCRKENFCFNFVKQQ